MSFKQFVVGMIAAAVITAPASAAIISIKNGSTTVATVTCTAAGVAAPECQGVSGSPVGAFGVNAQAYSVTPANAESMAAFLNGLVGTTFTTGVRTNLVPADDTQDGVMDNDILEFTFTTEAAYFALKHGAATTFYKNLAGLVTLTVFFDRANGPTGAGFGLSNITEFGSTPEVPLPAAGWLMIAGVAGLGFAARRKKAV